MAEGLIFSYALRQETKPGAHVAKGRIRTYCFCRSATNPFHLLVSGISSQPATKLPFGDSLPPGCSTSHLESPLPGLSRIYLSPSFLKLSSLVFHDSALMTFPLLCLFCFHALCLTYKCGCQFSLFPYKHIPLSTTLTLTVIIISAQRSLEPAWETVFSEL